MTSALSRIKQNVDALIGESELEKRLRSKRPLRVKLGVDPTRPDLTFGHLVVLKKLRQFQTLGHEAILIIGDFTARIGDPSGRSATRPVLSAADVRANATTYLDQAFKVLDEQHTSIRYNSEWFDTLRFEDCLTLARTMTVARMLERDDFAQRYRQHIPISIVELLYPLIQGYDSIEIKAEVEIGGTDQLFNMLVGRKLQEGKGQPPQSVLTLPLLVGLDGFKKMSKSLDNYIAFNDSPKDMFGKIMSIDDTVMPAYYKLLLDAGATTLNRIQQHHPMEAKKQLAETLVAQFYSTETARYERTQFETVFSKHQAPDKMPVFSWQALVPNATEAPLIDLLAVSQLFATKSEARRLIQQGAVKINRQRQTDPHFLVTTPSKDHPLLIQAGKRRFFKVAET